MKKSEIHFTVQLDEQNIPDKIFWNATDNPNEGLEETKAIAIGVWDQLQKSTLKIDLWTKDMEIGDMKRFCIDIMGGLAESLKSATGDEKMVNDIYALCQTLSKHVEDEMKREAQ